MHTSLSTRLTCSGLLSTSGMRFTATCIRSSNHVSSCSTCKWWLSQAACKQKEATQVKLWGSSVQRRST